MTEANFLLKRQRLVQTAIAIVFLLPALAPRLAGREKDGLQYGEGLIINVPFAESEVEDAVREVVQNGIIRGTKEYNKDEYITGAREVPSSHAFPEFPEQAKIFYKEKLNTIDPRNFKNSSDVGTLTVRYVVQGQSEKSTVLRIDAVFVEDFRKVAHASNGSVETSEYKDIHDHLESTELMKEQADEALKENEDRRSSRSGPGKPAWSSSGGQSNDATEALRGESAAPATVANARIDTAPSTQDPPGAAPNNESSGPESQLESLQKRVQDLKQLVERLVKSPGAPLKTAPFHTASTLMSLPTGTEVLIVISTPYWYGVETHDGQHGWISRDELEPAK